jgi:hypothetical protein
MSSSRLSVIFVLVLALGIASPASALVDGGGPKKSDCYAQLDGVVSKSKRSSRIECMDGDPSCDTDGACNGTCEFRVSLCLNLDNMAGCTPGTITDVRIKGAELAMPSLPAVGATCGDFTTVSVATRERKGKRKPGKGKIKIKTFANQKPRKDKDRFVFVCKPRPDACPAPGEGKDDAVLDIPVISVDPPSPASQAPATVTVAAEAASRLTLTAVGAACGGFGTHQVNGNRLEVTRTTGTFGFCELTAVVELPGGPQTFIGGFEVLAADLTRPAVQVIGGAFLGGTLPGQSGGGSAPLIDTIGGPGSLINGGSARLRIELVDPGRAADVTAVQIAVTGAGGDTGFYEAPAVRDGNTIVVDVALVDDGGESAGSSASDESEAAGLLSALRIPLAALEITGVDLDIQLVDRFEQVGNRVTRHFDVEAVGSGALQVSLSWDTPTDVDLHLVTPTGQEIYWANREAEGGELDLDSNAACGIDGINNENITFAEDAPEGQYIARVDFWSDCGGLDANYTVTTRSCGEIQTYQGSFAPGTGDGGGAGSGVEVARFISGCRWRVRGRALYEDFPQTPTGLATTPRMLPIRSAEVRVRRDSNGAILVTGETGPDGTFDLRFSSNGPWGYYVEVLAQNIGDSLRQAVKDDAGAVYAVRSSGIIVEPLDPDKTDVAIVATRDGGAGAFNIFDQGVTAVTFVKSVVGSVPPYLDWRWVDGEAGSCVGNISCYDASSDTISVLSIPADRDEYDDAVLLHQYGHFFLRHFARTDSPGGPHSVLNRVDPRLAFAEGAATFFGNAAKGSSLYVDTTLAGVGARFDLEYVPSAIPLGTSDGTLAGNVSEAVVAAILWDLVDATNEGTDTLTQRAAVFSALTYLRSPAFADRGVPGVDLVDFLDGWFCKGNGSPGDSSSGVQGNVTTRHQFSYDFPTLPACP